MLDLAANDSGTERCPPLERIGVAAVRNHHVGQEVRRQSDIRHRLLNWEVLEAQLQHADRLTAAGHRRKHASAAVLRDHLDGLGGQRPCGVPASGMRSAVSFPCSQQRIQAQRRSATLTHPA
jgi:hypothetical protein